MLSWLSFSGTNSNQLLNLSLPDILSCLIPYDNPTQLRKANSGGPPIPPAINFKGTQVLTEEAVTTTLRRAIGFYSTIQAHDGHWPAESAGPLFFSPPLVCLPLNGLTFQESK